MAETRSRVTLIAVAALAIGAAGTYQFVWSSLRLPLGSALGASEASLGTVFTVFLVFQSLSQFPVGWVRDRYGPRVPLLVGAPLLAAGYAGTAFAGSLPVVYASYAVGGVGCGAVYTVAVSVGLLAAAVVRDPPEGVVDTADDGSATDGGETTTGDETVAATGWRETVRTWQFWLLYAVMIVVNGVGLMLIGKVVAYADALGLPGAVATAGASVVAFADAAGIVTVGGLSDRYGRVRTLSVSLVCAGLALLAATVAGDAGAAWVFAVLVGLAALFRSPTFAVFPTLVGEYYGAARSSENYALLYTGKVWGSVFGGTVASLLVVSVGWSTSFRLAAVVLAVAGVATGLLRPPE